MMKKMKMTGGATAQHDGDDSSTDDSVDDHLVIYHSAHSHYYEEVLTSQDHPGPPEDDNLSDDATATPTLEDDGIVDDSDNNSNNELRSLCRQPSESATQCLSEDTFSFLIYSQKLSGAFFLATLVFLFQIAIYVVLAIDIIDASNPRNPMKLPVNVGGAVRAAEFLAIVVAIITQDDARKAANLLRDGFDQNLVNAHKGATQGKWILSIMLRAFEGLFGLFLTFLLIMQSSTVIELLLNFLAMEFVSQLDDVVFVLTSEGFMGNALQKDAKKLCNTYYHVSHLSEKSTWAASFATFAYFGVLFVAFFAGWSVIIVKQKNGAYLCQHIFAQFGDEVVPMLGTFTGFFDRQEKIIGNRLTYRDNQDGGALLAYCREQERWTLSLTTDNVGHNVYDPCTWIAASDESKDFDVLTTANSQWVVKDAAKGILPLSRHFLACHNHKHNMLIDNSCAKNGLTLKRVIGYVGQNEDNLHRCKCKSKWDLYGVRPHGLECTYSERCQELKILTKQDDKGFVKTGGTNPNYFATKYSRLKGAEVYNRPVYTSLLGQDKDFDIIVFTGTRWILSHKSLFPGLKDVKSVTELSEYFSKFHGHFTTYNTSYVSEPVNGRDTLYTDYDSQLDAEASFPSNLKWHYSSASQSTFDQQLQPDLEKGSVEARFTCAECNNNNNCARSWCNMNMNDRCSITTNMSFYELDFLYTPNKGAAVGYWVLDIVLLIVLPVCCMLLCCCACRKCFACRKNAINTHDAEMGEAQY